MKQIHIAVIDDGINEAYFHTGSLLHNVEISPALEIYNRTGYNPYLLSHGTNCAAIIKKYAPDAVISSVKILNGTTFTAKKDQLVLALEWCYTNRISLVHLSLGSIFFKDFEEISALVDNMIHSGIILVAACHNRNIFTCPASLSGVIGVKCDTSRRLHEMEYLYHSRPKDGIRITACSEHTLVNCHGEAVVTPLSNSYAAPYITALVHRIMTHHPDITLVGVLEELQIHASALYGEAIDSVPAEDNGEVPLVAVFDYTGSGIEWGEQLAACFRKDGYHAMVLSDNPSHHDPCKGILASNGLYTGQQLHESLGTILRIHEPDLVFLSMTKEWFVDPPEGIHYDIRFMLTDDEPDNTVPAYGNHNPESTTIVLATKEKLLSIFYPHKASPAVYPYREESPVLQIYTHMAELLKGST